MSGKKEILSHLGWGVLVVAAYFLGTRGREGEPDRAAPLKGTSTHDVSVSGVDQRVSRMFQEIADRGRMKDALSEVPDGGAEGLTAALKEMEAVLASEEEQLCEFARSVTTETALPMLEVFLSTPRSGMTDRVFLEFVQAWGRVAGREAVEYVLEAHGNAESDTRLGAAGLSERAMAGWASTDSEAAMKYVANMMTDAGESGDTWRSTRMHVGILDALEATDLDAAIAYSQELYADALDSWNASYLGKGDVSGIESVVAAVMEQRGLLGLESWFADIETSSPALMDYKRRASEELLDVM